MTSVVTSTATDDVTAYPVNSTWGAVNFQDESDDIRLLHNLVQDEDSFQRRRQQSMSNPASSSESTYWCLCDVPSEDYPIGVTTGDPSGIDAAYLTIFGVEGYNGDVISNVVNSSQEVKDNSDTSFTDEKMVISLASKCQ